MRILKFGGSSLGKLERVKKVVQIISRAVQEDQIIVVVSAFGGVTDKLLSILEEASSGEESWKERWTQLERKHLQLLYAMTRPAIWPETETQLNFWFKKIRNVLQNVFQTRDYSPDQRDLVCSVGERFAATIIAAALKSQGLNAGFIDATKLIRINENSGTAIVDFSSSEKNIKKYLGKNRRNFIPVVTGFIGATAEGKTTTLGRNGSDYTATIIGSVLKADQVQIWSDVDGILTADPALVAEAIPIPEISYEDAAALAQLGNGVLHPCTIAPLRKKGVKALIKNTLNPKFIGTEIKNRKINTPPIIKIISASNNFVLISLPNTPVQIRNILKIKIEERLKEREIPFILTSKHFSDESLCFAVPSSNANACQEIIEQQLQDIHSFSKFPDIRIERDCGLVSLIGEKIQYYSGLTQSILQILQRHNIQVTALSNGYLDNVLSFVVKDAQTNRALKILHDSLIAPRQEIYLVISGATGQVGTALLQQIQKKRLWMIQQKRFNVKIIGSINTRRMVWNEKGIEPTALLEKLENGQPSDWSQFLKWLQNTKISPVIFVDCTAAESIAKDYLKILNSGISIVTPSKIANTLDFSFYAELQKTIREKGLSYRYETTVGAATPFIQNIQTLIEGGENIYKIEGLLSGTLSFVFSLMNEGISFSEAVRQARDLGFTEPHPALDLSGEDVARKILILIREAGYSLERDQIHVESLVPQELQTITDPDEFLEKLKARDDYWAVRVEKAKKLGKQLCYLASFNGTAARVEVVELPQNSPFARVAKGENVVAYYTDRHFQLPLIIRGLGAGPDFTASGVLDDIIQAAEFLINKRRTYRDAQRQTIKSSDESIESTFYGWK